jgi:Mlc titration factor MtfA (ptsG expression regulator)
VLSGEAMEGGPVMLSWRDVDEAGESAAWGYNVVVHEFAHVLDMADGQADGMPPLSDAADRQRWQLVLSAAYKRFCRRVERGADTGIDPYGAESLEEFFAVTTEVFFVAPAELKAESAALYALYADYFRQDPGATP